MDQTERPCVCETEGHCEPCRPPINPNLLTDDDFWTWAGDQLEGATPEHIAEIGARVLERISSENPVIVLTQDHLTLRRAMDANDEAGYARWVDPDDPGKLTTEGTRLYLDTLNAF